MVRLDREKLPESKKGQVELAARRLLVDAERGRDFWFCCSKMAASNVSEARVCSSPACFARRCSAAGSRLAIAFRS